MPKKKKKKGKYQAIHKAVKPFIKDSRVLYGMLGAVGAGVALASALGPDKAGSLVHRITSAIKQLAQHSEEDAKPEKDAKQPKGRKPPRPFSTENF